MFNKRRLTPTEIDEARALLAKGWTYSRIAEKFGVDRETVKRPLDPEWAEKRRLGVRKNRQERGYSTSHGKLTRQPESYGSIRADVAARLAEIPTDTRSFTAQFFGDPIPGDPRRPWRKEPRA